MEGIKEKTLKLKVKTQRNEPRLYNINPGSIK